MYYIEQLTVRKDDDPKFDGEKMTNEFPTEEVTSFDVCPLTICRPKPPPGPGTTTVKPVTCTIYRSGWRLQGSESQLKTLWLP